MSFPPASGATTLMSQVSSRKGCAPGLVVPEAGEPIRRESLRGPWRLSTYSRSSPLAHSSPKQSFQPPQGHGARSCKTPSQTTGMNPSSTENLPTEPPPSGALMSTSHAWTHCCRTSARDTVALPFGGPAEAEAAASSCKASLGCCCSAWPLYSQGGSSWEPTLSSASSLSTVDHHDAGASLCGAIFKADTLFWDAMLTRWNSSSSSSSRRSRRWMPAEGIAVPST
mmetsp:Transcript_28357/g.80051  ORF Transcript_28357/g.80051 Transcript_28357/m.80051 type:complete len:226 (-) Transcript_28357:337-1014(-)